MSRILMVLLLFGTGESVALAQIQDGQTSNNERLVAPPLESVFDDDFSTNTLGEYEVQGKVSWEAGKLLLSDGASFKRDILGGPWAKVRLELESAELSERSPRSEIEVRFMLDEATDCFVRLKRELRNGKVVASVGLFDTGEQDGKQIETLVREADYGSLQFSDISIVSICASNGTTRLRFKQYQF